MSGQEYEYPLRKTLIWAMTVEVLLKMVEPFYFHSSDQVSGVVVFLIRIAVKVHLSEHHLARMFILADFLICSRTDH